MKFAGFHVKDFVKSAGFWKSDEFHEYELLRDRQV